MRELEEEFVREVIGRPPQTQEEHNKSGRLRRKFQIGIQRGKSDPEVNALIDVDTNEQRLELLQGMKNTMNEDEFAEIRNLVLREGLVNPKLFNQLK